MKVQAAAILISAFFLGACTWVETTEEGAQVQLVAVAAVGCQHIGTVTTSVKDNVGFIDRNEDRVREELVALAKNRAAILGGNTLVMSQPPVEGEAGFDVFSCS